MSYEGPGAPELIERFTIRMPYVSNKRRFTVASWPFVTPWSPKWLRHIAERLGRQFRRETGFDFPPYLAEDPEDQEVVLLPAKGIHLAGGILIAGAIGIDDVDTVPRFGWAYVHPYQRGKLLVEDAWPNVGAKYPNIRLEQDPDNTSAGNALLERLRDLNGQ